MEKIGQYFTTVVLGEENIEIEQKILSSGRERCNYSRYFLSKLSTEEKEVEVWKVSGLDMGFEANTHISFQKILDRALELGFNLLSMEAVFLASLHSKEAFNARITPVTHPSTRECRFMSFNGRMVSTYMEPITFLMCQPATVWIFEKRKGGDK